MNNFKLAPYQMEAKMFYFVPHYTATKKRMITFDEVASCVGVGWKGLLEELVVKLLKLGWGGGIDQIKEKFGTLRFYWQNDIEDPILARIAEDVVCKAEDRSCQVCEDCGEYGKSRSDRAWIRTLCDCCDRKDKK